MCASQDVYGNPLTGQLELLRGAAVDLIPAPHFAQADSGAADDPQSQPAAIPDLLIAVQLPEQLSSDTGSLDCSLQVARL